MVVSVRGGLCDSWHWAPKHVTTQLGVAIGRNFEKCVSSKTMVLRGRRMDIFILKFIALLCEGDTNFRNVGNNRRRVFIRSDSFISHNRPKFFNIKFLRNDEIFLPLYRWSHLWKPVLLAANWQVVGVYISRTGG
jgi:hypothetical protein